VIEKSALGLVFLAGMGAVIGLVFGWVMLFGWLVFLVYRAVAPEAWITLNLWPCVGIAALLTIVLRGRTVYLLAASNPRRMRQ
jgi:predicted lysophospholipase L1 biosynthesis ABC-type transport system permease subunit